MTHPQHAASIVYDCQVANTDAIVCHLEQCAGSFVPDLRTRVDLAAYAQKLAQSAVTFEAWQNDRLVGLVAAYLNRPETGCGFVSNVSVTPAYSGTGVARALIDACRRRAAEAGISVLRMEVGAQNQRAIGFYRKIGFKTTEEAGDTLRMELLIHPAGPVSTGPKRG